MEKTRTRLIDENQNIVEKGYSDPSFFIAKKLRDSYNTVSHIENLFSEDDNKKWVTSFILSGRYEVVYKAPVKVAKNDLVLLGGGEIYLNEIVKVVSANEVHYGGVSKVFSGKEFDKLVDSDFDFFSFGIPSGQPIKGIDEYFNCYRAQFN